MSTAVEPVFSYLFGWRLNALIVAGTLLLTNVVVALVAWLLLGRISFDTLMISSISSLIIATLVVSVTSVVRERISKMHRQSLEIGIARAQSLLTDAIEAAEMLFWEFDLTTGQFQYDHTKLRWLGVAADTPASTITEWLALVHPDDRGPFIQSFQAALPVGAPDFSFEYRFKQAPGAWGWVHTQGRIKQRNAQGEPLLAVGGTLNITRRKQVESDLIDSESLLKTMLSATDEGILMVAEDGRVLSANQRFLELWCVPEDMAVAGRDDLLLAHVLDQLKNPDLFIAQVQRLYGSDDEARDTLYFKDGRVFTRYSRALTIHRQRGRIWCFKDVTEQKLSEQALMESNQFQHALLDAIPIPIFYKDEQGFYLGFNHAYEKFIGRSQSDLVGKTVFDIAPQNLADIYYAQDQHLMAQGGTHVYESQVSDSTGQCHDVVFHKAVFSDSTGQVRGLIGGILDITARKQSEQALVLSEQRTQALYMLLRRVADNVPDMIWAKDTDKRYLFANKAICEQLLLARDTDEPVGKDDLFFASRARAGHPENPHWHTFGELCQDSDAITLQRGMAVQFEEFGNVNGELLHLDVHKAPLVGEQGEIMGVVGSARNVTEQRKTQEKLKISAMVLENSSEALMLSDADNRIVDINPAFTQLTGYTLAEIEGESTQILHSGQHGTDFFETKWAQISATGRWQGEIWSRRKNGEIFAEWLTINTLYRDDGGVHRRVGLFSDITAKKRSEELIWTQANFDALTGLPNRRMFMDRLAQDLKKAHRGNFKLALLFLDLDRFKEVNDTLGHAAGDALLVEAAGRIAACIRESDTVARIGGDEFTVILAELTDASPVERIANDILARLTQPFLLGSNQVYVSVSIGITVYPDDAVAQEEMLKNADQAMYVSKEDGRNRFSYFTRAMQEGAQRRQHLLNDLRGALDQHQFELHYQPIMNLQTGQIHKAEALLRWTHPVRGPVGPTEYIALAEESGLIHDLGKWVFAHAVIQAERWRANFDPAFQISVNLSPLQIQNKNSRLDWQSVLQAARLAGDAIVFEITEGLLLDKSPEVSAELLAYRDAGIQVAIDDFGTGYSAMAYLKQLDIDYLKIDQTFVRNLAPNASDHALCEAIVVMAHKLGIKVIAEGVETPEQRDLLLGMGCDFAQGFLYAKAVSAPEFERFFHQNSDQTGL